MKHALAAVLVVACGSRSELDAPASCPSTSMKLPVEQPWIDTGIDVVAGQRLVVHASGTVHYGSLAQQQTGPNGGNFDGTQFFPTSIYPKVPVCALIGKVGEAPVPSDSNHAPGFVGADYDEVMTASGRLFLGFNDQMGWFSDNAGAFDVDIAPCP